MSIFAIVVLTIGTVAQNSSNLDLTVADKWQRVCYEGQVGKETYQVILGSSLFARRITREGNARAASRVEVEYLPAYGMKDAWIRPISQLSEFRILINNREKFIHADVYKDVYNVRLQPIGGTTPPCGNVAVSVLPHTGEIIIYIRPVPGVSAYEQSSDSEITWKIAQDGKWQRKIEVVNEAERKIIHKVGVDFIYEYNGTSLRGRQLPATTRLADLDMLPFLPPL